MLNETPTIAPRAERPVEAVSPSQRLPTDLLRKSRERLRLITLLVMFGFALDFAFATVDWATTGMRTPLVRALGSLTGNYIGLVWGGAMLAATLSRRLSDRRVMTAGLIFQVGVCMVISVWNTAGVWKDTGFPPSLTWVTPVIIMIPLIIPNPPGRVLLASLASAMTAPLAVAILDSASIVAASGEHYVLVAIGPLTATVFAYVGARVVFGLGLEVRQGQLALERERQMGSYRLESLIGRGGMGEVWRAKHRLIARPAAIKLIRPQVLGSDDVERGRVMERFRREAEATASMRSPHTIEVYDFGQTDEGAFYYVMELLDGVDLETLVRRFGAVPAERAIHIVLQMCRSLGEAHDHGLIHRDIKPANVFVCRFGRDDDFVKVLDFGLVKSSSGAAGDDATLTREHTALGTPAFMSPEQVVGQDAVDSRSDIYAIGCVAYWLLTGVLVFEADSAAKMMMSQVRDVPLPPSERSEMPVSKALDEIVLRCLAKSPDDRPQSVDVLAGALSALPMANQWTPARARDWWDSHLPSRPGAG